MKRLFKLPCPLPALADQREHLLPRLFVVVAVVFSGAASVADDSVGATIDCSSITIDYQDDETLTRAERLEKMNRAFYESLDQFELCRIAADKPSMKNADGAGDGSGTGGEAGVAGGNAGAGDEGMGDEGTGGNGAGGNGAGDAGAGATSGLAGNVAAQGDETPIDSVANSELSGEGGGEEGKKMSEALPEGASGQPPGREARQQAHAAGDVAAVNEKRESVSKRASSAGGHSGKRPEDITDIDNDDAVAAQIRLAAEIEEDPEKKAQLWNEYRKYKGLPTQ